MAQMKVPPAIAKLAPDGNLTPRQRRHFLIQMGLRRVRPGSGSSLEFLRRRTAVEKWPDLREVLRGIPWVVIGGVATRAYMPERKTKDLDILVHHDDGPRVIERLRQAEYKVVSRLAVPGYLMRSPDDVEVDVIFGKQPWLKKALAHPHQDPANYPVLALPYLVLMKLAASRAHDWADVSRMVALASDTELDVVRAVVARYQPADKEDLESLIFLGKKELEMPPDDAQAE